MSTKHFQNLKWKSVPLEEVHSTGDFEGLVAIEECSEYNVDILRINQSQFGKVKTETINKNKKRKIATKNSDNSSLVPPNKKPKVGNKLITSNGFIVEDIALKKSKQDVGVLVRSTTKHKDSKRQRMKKKLQVKIERETDLREKSKLSKTPEKSISKKTPGLGEFVISAEPDKQEREANLTDEMNAWMNMGIPDVILTALADQGFREPTEIQRLTLPPSILGRRDILGAAQTGSGKTLAFGIPIVAGILQIKETILSGVDFDHATFKKLASKKSPQITVNKQPLKENKKEKFTKKRHSLSSKSEGEENSNPNIEKEEEFQNDFDFDEEFDDENPDEINEWDDGLDDENFENRSETGDGYFQEEEEAGGLDKNGIGCVKVIDNIEPIKPKRSNNMKPLYALILTPTRELAVQIRNHLVALAKHTDIRVAVLVGGMAHVKQERILSKCPEIVVATPGRLWELIQQGNDHLSQIDNIRFLAIDETDRMLERGHFEELQSLLERINTDDSKRAARQSFVFSATLTLVHDLPDHAWRKRVTKRGKIVGRKMDKMTPQKKLKRLIEMLGITNPKVVDVTSDNQGKASTLLESRISCPIDYKDFYLYYILKSYPGRTIVFCNSIGCVKRLAQLFSLLRCNPLPLHAGMQQRQRLKNLERFRDNPHGVLVSTDVAARGLDIPNIDHVIHYQVPRTAENYVHRSGRTARATKEGITILMMEPSEAMNYTKLCKTLGKREDLPLFPVPDPLLLATKDRVNLARDLDRMELRTKKTNTETGWLQKAITEMDIIVDDDEMPIKESNDSVSKNVLDETRKRLTVLLNKPLFPKGFSFKYPSVNDTNNVHSFDSDAGKENALDVMKSALQSGLVKKLKKRTKNEALLKMSSSGSSVKIRRSKGSAK